MNTDRILICRAEVYLKSDNLSETESIYTNNSSTQNTSFYGSGSLDSPAHSANRSNYPSIEYIGDSELVNSARSRNSSVSSDDESPCWRNMVLFLDDQDQVPWTDDHFEFDNYKSYTSFKSIPDISETYAQCRTNTRRPSRFLQEHASENPNSWQAKALIGSGQKIPKEKGKKSSLWRQVLSKEKKVKLIVEEDPLYVQRLLHKLVKQNEFSH
jgi:TFIIF-interacting CTD phosphatase-like protein